jgi:hypothetical protein
MLVVTGEAIRARTREAIVAQRSAGIRAASAAGTGGSPPSASASQAQAIRQQLASPDRPVGAQPGAVEDRADGRTAFAMLGQAGRQVCVVMLDPHQPHSLARQGVRRREVVRMQVVRDHGGRRAEQPLEVRDPLLQGLQRLVVPEVADVMADPRPPALGEAEGGLELGSHAQQRLIHRDG